MLFYIIVAVVFILWAVIVWFLGGLFDSTALKWTFRGVFWFLGLVGVLLACWFRYKKKNKTDETVEDEIDQLVKEAELRLKNSAYAKTGKLKGLPVLFILGEQQAAKTTTVLGSGTEPEVLAGTVYGDNAIAPTRTGAMWLARNTVMFESGSNLLDQLGAWNRFVSKLRPSRMKSAFGAEKPRPRAALVCVEASLFTRQDAREAVVASARRVREQLTNAAKILGVNLPVYVLVTKLDQVQFFADYIRNATGDEAHDVVGTTLHGLQPGPGVYGDRQASRVAAGFDEVFYWHSERRLMMLSRETQRDPLPGIYEFPRELGKVRDFVIRYMVELCRPSQLTVSPFLRGFYFTGFRKTMVTQGIEAAAPAMQQSPEDEYGSATAFFRAGDAPQAAPQAPSAPVTKEVDQWVYLTRLFDQVLLGDRAAQDATTLTTSGFLVRRLLLALATILFLTWGIGATVSYFNNRALENRAIASARVVEAYNGAPGTIPPTETLAELDILREVLVEGRRRAEGGFFSSYGWGLNRWATWEPTVYRTYFDNFRKLILDDTLERVVADLNGLPNEVDTESFQHAEVLSKMQAYVIATNLHQCSNVPVIQPLYDRWLLGRVQNMSPEQINLAANQFQFFAEDLRPKDPYPELLAADPALRKGNEYLSLISAFDRQYFKLISDARNHETTAPFQFNRDLEGTAATVSNTYEVPAEFTGPGWEYIKGQLEAGVGGGPQSCPMLGNFVALGDLPANFTEQFTERYANAAINHWQTFLEKTDPLAYGCSASSAASRLTQTSADSSPVLAAIWVVSSNTANMPEPVQDAFADPIRLVPPDTIGMYRSDINGGYLGSLVGLSTGWARIASDPKPADNIALLQEVKGLVIAAEGNVGRLTTVSGAGVARRKALQQTARILREPVSASNASLRCIENSGINGGAKQVCDQLAELLRLYPFATSGREATIEDVRGLFHRSDGFLWQYYQEHLADKLVANGTRYDDTSGQLRRNFVEFFNRAASVSRAFYPREGATEPAFSYRVTSQPFPAFSQAQLKVDGNTLVSGANESKSAQFTWPGSGQGASIFITAPAAFEVTPSAQGLWSAWRLFAQADERPANGNGVYTWIQRSGVNNVPQRTPDGEIIAIKYSLQANPPLLQPGWLFGQLRGCVSVAQ